jgi:hypothetical protein
VDYFKRIVLELSVLKAEGRQDKMENLNVTQVALTADVTDQAFRVRIFASATDIGYEKLALCQLKTPQNPIAKSSTR